MLIQNDQQIKKTTTDIEINHQRHLNSAVCLTSVCQSRYSVLITPSVFTDSTVGHVLFTLSVNTTLFLLSQSTSLCIILHV